MQSFNLSDYLDEVRAIANHNLCTLTAAVDRIIVNLNTFNEYHVGTGALNYHVLGHYWGALTAAQKIEQKKEAKRLVSEPDMSATSIRKNRRSKYAG